MLKLSVNKKQSITYLCSVQRKFVGNMMVVMGLNWLIKPIWIFLIERVAQNKFGESLYGNYFVIYNLCLLFVILLDFGINSNTARLVAQDRNQLSKFQGLAWLKLLLSGLYFLIVFSIGIIQQLDPILLMLLCFNQVLIGFIQFFRANLQGLHLFKTDSIVSVTDRFVAALLCGLWLFIPSLQGNFTIMLFVLFQTIGYAAALLFGLWQNLRNLPKISFSFNKSEVIDGLKQNLPYALLTLQMAIFTRIDAVLIMWLAPNGFYEAGIYAQGFRLLDAGLIFSGLLSSMLLPIFASNISTGKDVREVANFNLRLIIPAVSFALILAITRGNELFGRLYTFDSVESQNYSTLIFIILMGSFVSMASIHVFGTLLTAAGKIKLLNRFSAITIVVNIGMNLILIPKYHALGAALGCMISQLVFALLCFYRSFTDYHFKFQGALILKLAISSAFLFVLLKYSNSLPINFWFQIMASGLAFAICLFALKIIKLKIPTS